MFISSPFVALDIPIPTLIPWPDTFVQVTPIITVVVAPGTVYIPTVDTPILFFDFYLKVLAIFYS